MPQTARPIAVLFDLDGTLIDSSPGVIEAVNFALSSVGESARQPKEIKPWIGYSLQVMFAGFCDAPYDELRARFLEKADNELAGMTAVLPGANESVQHLSSLEYRMGIVSTKRRLHIEQILTQFGWQDLFEIVVGGDEVTKVKPDTEAFLLALSRLKLRSDEAVVVGDTENDILPAKQLGMFSYAVRSVYHNEGADWSPAVLASKPDIFLENLTELSDQLTRLMRNGK